MDTTDTPVSVVSMFCHPPITRHLFSWDPCCTQTRRRVSRVGTPRPAPLLLQSLCLCSSLWPGTCAAPVSCCSESGMINRSTGWQQRGKVPCLLLLRLRLVWAMRVVGGLSAAFHAFPFIDSVPEPRVTCLTERFWHSVEVRVPSFEHQ